MAYISVRPFLRGSMAEQNYGNHKKYVLGYHGVVFGFVVLTLAWSVKQLVSGPSLASAIQVITAMGLMGVFFYARIFALQVQNRLIRLEEQLRMARVLPDDLKAKVGDLRVSQLIALRFAPDDELSALVRRVLAGELTSQDDIKRAIVRWRADYVRA